LIGVAALFPGCGGGGGDKAGTSPSAGGSDGEALRKTIKDHYASFQKPAEFCEFLSRSLLTTLGGREACEKEQQRFARAGATREVEEFKALTIKGRNGTVTTRVARRSPSASSRRVGDVTQGWVKQGGEWKLDSTVIR